MCNFNFFTLVKFKYIENNESVIEEKLPSTNNSWKKSLILSAQVLLVSFQSLLI